MCVYCAHQKPSVLCTACRLTKRAVDRPVGLAGWRSSFSRVKATITRDLAGDRGRRFPLREAIIQYGRASRLAIGECSTGPGSVPCCRQVLGASLCAGRWLLRSPSSLVRCAVPLQGCSPNPVPSLPPPLPEGAARARKGKQGIYIKSIPKGLGILDPCSAQPSHPTRSQ